MIKQDLKLSISKAMQICIAKGYKVSPQKATATSFKVVVEKPDGDLHVYDKLVSAINLNAALSKTYKAWALLLLKKDKEVANAK